MIKNIVSISVADNGDVYVSETARRKAADLDIRSHHDWIPNDVSFQSIEDKRNFYKSELSPQNSDHNKTWLKDFNHDGSHDWKDLSVIKDKIHKLRDLNDDGKADEVITYADDLGSEVAGIAAGVLIFNHEVYTTIAPDVWKFKDLNADGKADQKESIAHGFGLHIAYAGHDMHGLRVGPDGRIYWSIGDKGVSVVDQKGMRHHYPNQGCVLRCNPDGSDFKVFAHGLRNVQEIAFDEYGNMFGVDNDSDRKGELERFVYITEDSDSGWRCNYQYRSADYNPWMAERLWEPLHSGQASYITPPIINYLDGPTGFTYNPGTALSPAYRGHFFMTQFPKKTLMTFKVNPKEAGFEMVESEKIYEGVNLTGLSFGPNGELWASDWGGGYDLNELGGVWKFDVETPLQNPERASTHEWLNKNYAKLSPSELSSGLEHPDQRVRLKAQFQMVERQLATELIQIALSDHANLFARIHAIWGMGQLLRKQDSKELSLNLVRLLQDTPSEIKAQALKVMADCNSNHFPTATLLVMLKDSSARVQFFAAKAIAKHPHPKEEETISALEHLIDQHPSIDPFLRHAIASCLTGAVSSHHLGELAKHPNLTLRLTAVVALRRQKSDQLALFLNDSDELVTCEAARAIYDDFSVFEALPALSKLIDSNMSNESLWRRVLNSHYRLGTLDNAKALAEFSSDESKPLEQRIEALAILDAWIQPTWADRVNGRYREPTKRDLSDFKPQLQSYLEKMMSSPSQKIQSSVAQLSGKLKLKADPKTLYQWLCDDQREIDSRVDALRYLFAEADYQEKTLAYSLASKQPQLRATAASMLLKKDLNKGLIAAKPILSKGNIWEKQQLVLALASLTDKKSASLLEKLLTDLLEDKTEAGLALELFEAAKLRQLGDYEARYLNKQQKNSALDALTPLMHGGDAQLGKKIFNEHISAQCIRCHAVGGSGSAVGPDLAGVANRYQTSYLAESLVAPNQKIAPGYGITSINTKGGALVAGTVLEESEQSIQIKTPDGKVLKLNRNDIQTQTPTMSMMPPMRGILTDREIRDVVAYLSELK